MNTFLTELRRRNVFRVTAAYLVVGWLVLQIVNVLTPALELPSWVDGFIAVLLIAGLPIAILLAWAFEMTPEGMKRTGPAEGPIDKRPMRTSDYALIGLMLLVLAVAGLQIFMRENPTGAVITAGRDNIDSVSVAVLPFADMSEAGDQVFFSDGISEEILNVLVRIPGLAVAGRTSSFAFKGRNEDLRTIGETLGVAYVLEGSVRRSGGRLRITAQLIRSADGFHLWSETYDRDLLDIFVIQDEIAAAVAEELAVSLGLERGTRSHDRTDDIAAYDLYLQGRSSFLSFGAAKRGLAITLLNDALAHDPDYARVWTTLAGVYSVHELYHPDPIQTDSWRSAGMSAARRAIELDPLSGEAYAYLGVLQAYDTDWLAAFESFDRALELEPNNPAVLNIVAQRMADAGYGEQASIHAARATGIDPLVPVYWNTLGWSRVSTPGVEWGQTIEPLRTGLELDPTLDFIVENAMHELTAYGQQTEAMSLLEAGIASGAVKGRIADDWRSLLDTWPQGADAIRALLPELTPHVRVDAALALKDTDLFLTSLEAIWAETPRNNLHLFWTFLGDYRNDPRWKARAEADGLVALWRVRGFPTGCRATSDDDFECD